MDRDDWTPADHTAAEAIAGPRLEPLLHAAVIKLPIAASRIRELSAILEATFAADEMPGP